MRLLDQIDTYESSHRAHSCFAYVLYWMIEVTALRQA